MDHMTEFVLIAIVAAHKSCVHTPNGSLLIGPSGV